MKLRSQKQKVDSTVVNERTVIEAVRCKPVRSNVVHVFSDRCLGHNSWSRLEQVGQTPLLGSISSLRIHKSASPFGRRIMAISWFPESPNKLAVGSKAGNIYIWDLQEENNSKFIDRPEYGPGYAIFAMRFHRNRPDSLLVACGDGSLTREDVAAEKQFAYDKLVNWRDWFCSVESSRDGKLVLGGDNKGSVIIYSDEGQKIRQMKLHGKKVTHMEFNAKDEWLLATSSVDRTVKMWDIRKLESRQDCLQSFEHEAGVNNATFNPRDGTRMLTTDQDGQIRVYCGPLWTLSQTINHPHRQFQHMTPIKASWHPLDDVIVVGRYPNPNSSDYINGDLRTIDFFGAPVGKELLRLSDWDMTGIVSLNYFNLTGDMMASAMGYNVLIWKSKKKKLADEDCDENTAQQEARQEKESRKREGKKSVCYFKVAASKKNKKT